MARIDEIVERALKEISEATTIEVLNNLKAQYLAKKSEIAAMMANFRNMTPEERTEVGKKVNDAKTTTETTTYTLNEVSVTPFLLRTKVLTSYL
jgi:phenylalanyl-tRNA synthetase alpha chain